MHSGWRLLSAFAVALALAAQQSPRRALTHQDYDSWRTISVPTLSPDGKFLAYALFPQDGNGDLAIRNLASNQEKREAAGAPPPPPEPDDGAAEPGPPPQRRTLTIRYTSDGRFLLSTAYPTKEETEKARRDRRRPGEMPNSLIIADLTAGTTTRVAEVRSMQVPEKGGSWAAYLKEPKPGERPEGERKGAPAGRGGGGAAAGRPVYGTGLVLRDLATGVERVIPSVTEYSFAKDGKTLIYAVSSRKEEENGVFAVSPGSDAAPAAILSGRGRYSRLSWDNDQKRLALMSTKDDPAASPPKYRLYLWERGQAAASEIVAPQTPGFREGYVRRACAAHFLARRQPVVPRRRASGRRT
ncbi:MAG: hypothetical protein ACRD44_06310 [Bryobacteraceae bacterium]